MQVLCMIDMFTLRIHMYNIIDRIVGIKFCIFCKRRVPISIILRSISKYGIVPWGGVGEVKGGSQRNEVYGCVMGLCYLALHHFANL